MSRKREVIEKEAVLYLFDSKSNEIKEHTFDHYFKTDKKISVCLNTYWYSCDVDDLSFCSNRYCLVIDKTKREEAKKSFVEMIRFELEKEIKVKENWLDVSKLNLDWFDNNLLT